MTDESDSLDGRILRDGMVNFGGLVFGFGTAFLARTLMGRWLGPSEYGVVTILITVTTILSTVALLGMDAGMSRYIPRQDDENARRGVIVTALRVTVPVLAITTTLAWLFADTIAVELVHDAGAVDTVRLFALAIPAIALTRFVIGAIRGVKATTVKVITQNIALPGVRLGFIVLFIAYGLGTLGVAYAYILANTLAVTMGGYYIWRRFGGISTRLTDESSRELLGYAVPLMFTGLMYTIFNDIDTLMIGYFLDTNAAGVYGAAYPTSRLLTIVLSAFGFILLPTLSELHAEGKYREIRRVYAQTSKWIFVISFPLLAVLVIFPDTVLTILFGDQYRMGASTLAVLSIGFFIHAIFGTNSGALQAFGYPRVILLINAMTAGVNIVLNLLLIPRHGVLGAAVTTTISYTLLNFAYSFYLKRSAGLPLVNQGIRSPIGVALIATAAGFGPSTLRLNLDIIDTSLETLVLWLATFLFVYGLGLRYTGVVTRDEWAFVTRRIK